MSEIFDGFDRIQFNQPEAKITEYKKKEEILEQIKSKLKESIYQDFIKDVRHTKLRQSEEVVFEVRCILFALEQTGYGIIKRNGSIYLYNGQFWEFIAKDQLEHFLGECAEILSIDILQAQYHVFKSDLYKQLLSASFQKIQVAPNNEVLINLKNGTFTIKDGVASLRDFSRADFLTYQLPFEYDPEASAPKFKLYLDKVLPDVEQQKVLSEFVGYSFVKHSYLKLEKFLILLGDGANGKSVFFDIISALLGPRNVSNYSLQSLTNENGYYRAMIADKLLNYSSEISPQMDTTIFKQLVSGEKVEARLPYGNPFVIEDYAKLLFNSNQLPRDIEHNHAFFRRFLIINFIVTITDGDPNLAKSIIHDELPGIFNWALEGLYRLLKQKSFTHSTEMKTLLAEYKRDSDTVVSFLEDEGYEKSTEKVTSLSTLYQGYIGYCRNSGIRPVTKIHFSKRLKNQHVGMQRTSKGMVVEIGKKHHLTPAFSSVASPPLKSDDNVQNAEVVKQL